MPPAHPRLLRFARQKFDSLASNGPHQFAAKFALSIYGADAVCSFIPKNACSTLRYSIALANGVLAGPEDFDWIHTNNQVFKADMAALAKARYTFVVLRDPFLRIVSCFLDKMLNQKPLAWQFHTLTDSKITPAMLTFRDFIGQLRPLLQANEHWRPQGEFLVYQDYDDYFCVEQFDDAVAVLRNRIGLTVYDTRGLAQHGLDRFTPLEGDETFADTPVHTLAALQRSGRVPRAAQLFDAALIAQVARLYAADIALYKRVIGRPCVFGAGSK